MPNIADLGKAVKQKYPGSYDDVPDAVLGNTIKQKYPKDYGDIESIEQTYKKLAPEEKPPEGSAAGRFLSGLAQAVNPGPALKRYLYDLPQQEQADLTKAIQSGQYGAAAKTILKSIPGVDLATDLGRAHLQQFQQAGAALTDPQGGDITNRLTSAGGHTLAGLLPGFGPAAAQAGVTMGSGDIAGGLGQTLGLTAVPELIKRLPVRGTVIPKSGRNLDPTEASAVRMGEEGFQNTIPGPHPAPVRMTMATRSSSPVVKNVQKVAQNTLGAGETGTQGLLNERADLQRTGTGIAEEIHPQAVTPETAGRQVDTALKTLQQAQKKVSKGAYGRIEAAEADPANSQVVTLSTGPGGVTKTMGLPVDMRSTQANVRTIYDQMKEEMAPGRYGLSDVMKKMENIINGDPYMPASVADQKLSVIKRIARENPETKQGYLAQKVIDDFEPAVQRAVARAGPQAVRDFADARELWKAKEATKTLRKERGLPTEPVQLFDMLTEGRDIHIDLLNDLQRHVPGSMPALGRAAVEGMVQKALAEAGQGKPGTMLTKWNNMGNKTKQILIKDPRIRQNLNDFFVLTERAAKNTNPSGTGTTLVSAGQLAGGGAGLGLVFHDPGLAAGTFATTVLAPALVSRLLLSQRGAKFLSRGLTTPIRNPAAAAVIGGQLSRAIKEQEESPQQSNQEFQLPQ
jgi:hypothetical protein